MVNILKNIILFVVSTISFSICFTTVIQFAIWLHRTGMRTNADDAAVNAGQDDGIRKGIILHNLLLLLLFVIQHTLMATNIFKHVLATIGFEVIQRSIYVIATCFTLQVLMHYWLPLYPEYPLWSFDHTNHHILWLLFTVIHILAWIIMLGIILVLDYGELIGVKQVYYYLINSPPPMELKSISNRRMFDHFRHPILMGLLLVLWFVPVMTLDRLLLAIVLTVYTGLGHRLDAIDYGYLVSQLRQKQTHLKDVQYSYWYNE